MTKAPKIRYRKATPPTIENIILKSDWTTFPAPPSWKLPAPVVRHPKKVNCRPGTGGAGKFVAGSIFKVSIDDGSVFAVGYRHSRQLAQFPGGLLGGQYPHRSQAA